VRRIREERRRSVWVRVVATFRFYERTASVLILWSVEFSSQEKLFRHFMFWRFLADARSAAAAALRSGSACTTDTSLASGHICLFRLIPKRGPRGSSHGANSRGVFNARGFRCGSPDCAIWTADSRFATSTTLWQWKNKCQRMCSNASQVCPRNHLVRALRSCFACATCNERNVSCATRTDSLLTCWFEVRRHAVHAVFRRPCCTQDQSFSGLSFRPVHLRLWPWLPRWLPMPVALLGSNRRPLDYDLMNRRRRNLTGIAECAGLNRHVVGDERALQERRTANPSWPRVLRGASRDVN
jgi:hypothetical protein